MFALRDYQQDAREAAHDALESHPSALLVLPTGTGKTEIFTAIAADWVQGKGRVLVIAPMIELVSQTAKKLCKRTGVMPAIEQADQRSNETEWGKCEYVVASKQSLTSFHKKSQTFRYQKFTDIGLVVVDEAHMAATKIYADMLDWFKARGAKVLGVTATPKRHDQRAMGQIFEVNPYQYSIADAIDDGWLVGCQASTVTVKSLDLSRVKTVAGDFHGGQLAEAMEDEKVCAEIADVTAREGRGLKTVVFCESVAEAQKISAIVEGSFGITSAFVCADKKLCPDQRRAEVLRSFTQDPEGIMVVTNCGVLTTGWDFPGLEHIVMARPTKSHALYCQIFGRGTRPLEGVVDFAGSTPMLRKDSIAQSRKPHFKMTDLVDASLEHKIVTALDVLGGKWSLEVLERAKADAVDAEAQDPEDALREAADALERERLRREEEEREKARWRQMRIEAQYDKTAVDPFDPYETGAVVTKVRKTCMPFGKHKGEAVSSLRSDYLNWILDNAGKAPWWLRNAIKTELEGRKARKPAVRQEVARVAKEGPVEDVVRKARLLIDELRSM